MHFTNPLRVRVEAATHSGETMRWPLASAM